MADKAEILMKNREQQTEIALKKAKESIAQLIRDDVSVNFSNASKESGVSRSFLYNTPEIRKVIEDCRERCVKNDINRRAKYDKTVGSKDVIIKAKDKRIANLEEENKQLKAELLHLRGLLYELN